MIKAEIIAANDGVKASELSRQLVLQGVRKEQAEALIEQISGNEAITSNTVLTKEQTTAILEQAEARKMLSAQQRKNIADDIEEAASSAQEASTEIAQASADMAESGTKIGSASSILARGVAQLGAGLKSFLSIFVSNPVAVIATITGSVIGLTYVIGKFQDTAKNAAKSASNFATSMSSANSTYNQEIDSLNELIEKYKDLREQLISAKGDEEKTYDIKSQMLELQKQLNEIYGDECDNVNLVTNAYRDQTEELKKNAKQKALIFADRFPFRYLTDDYGLDYYAAFPGCSAETEASFETVIFLAKKADENGDCIFITETSNGDIANAVNSNTSKKNKKILTLDSMQSVNKKDIKNGITYISVMEKNLETLEIGVE